MRKKFFYIVVAFIFIGVILGTINILLCDKMSNITTQISQSSDVQISLKDYKSGNCIAIDDPVNRDEFCKSIAKIKYDGLFLGRNYITNDEQAYSVIVSSKDMYIIVIISDLAGQAYVVGDSFNIAIRNFEDLYIMTKSAFN
mgnify:FL=1